MLRRALSWPHALLFSLSTWLALLSTGKLCRESRYMTVYLSLRCSIWTTISRAMKVYRTNYMRRKCRGCASTARHRLKRIGMKRRKGMPKGVKARVLRLKNSPTILQLQYQLRQRMWRWRNLQKMNNKQLNSNQLNNLRIQFLLQM